MCIRDRYITDNNRLRIFCKHSSHIFKDGQKFANGFESNCQIIKYYVLILNKIPHNGDAPHGLLELFFNCDLFLVSGASKVIK